MASDDHFILLDGQRLASCNTQLLFDQVNAGDHFGNRVFYLNTGVHFNEVELAVFEQELEGARSAVADIHTGFRATFADVATQFRGDARRRRFLDHFLVATLHGAVTLCQIDSVTLTVRQYLDLDVARIFQVFLHVDHVVIESRFRFRFGHGDRLRQFGVATHNAHTATAAAAGGLDDHRIANAFGMGAVSVHIVGQRAVRTWNGRDAGFLHRGDCGHFVAHQADSVGFRTDEDKAGALNLLGKVGVLGEETITRVNRYRAGDFRRTDDSRDVEIAFYGRSRANTDRLIR